MLRRLFFVLLLALVIVQFACGDESGDGGDADGYFINIASFGMAGLVDRYVNESSKSLGGTLSFLTSTVRAATTYRNQRVDVTLDDTDNYSMKIINLAVANGQFFGGGMRVAPQADIADGLLDVIAVGDMGKMELLRAFPTIYKGTHIHHPKVRMEKATRVAIGSTEKFLVHADGEFLGEGPVSFRLMPSALSIAV